MNTSDFQSDESVLFEVLGSSRSAPEGRLMIAVLERAVLDYIGNETSEAEDAERWIFEDYETDLEEDPEFSFNWVCDELGLTSTHVRAVIGRMPKRGQTRVAPWYVSKSYHNEPRAEEGHDNGSPRNQELMHTKSDTTKGDILLRKAA